MDPASGAQEASAKKNAARAARQMLIRSAPPAILLWAFVSGSHYMSRLELNIGYAMLWGYMCGVLTALGHPGAEFQLRDGGVGEMNRWKRWACIVAGVGVFALGAYAYLAIPWLILFELTGAYLGWFWFDWFRRPARRESSIPAEPH